MNEPRPSPGDADTPSLAQHDAEQGRPHDKGAAAAEDGSIDKAIERLEKEQEEALEKKVSADSAFADKENRLTALRAAQRDLDANQKSYEAAYEKLTGDEQAYDDFFSSEKERLEKLLQQLAGEVKDKDEARTAERKSRETAVAEATKALRNAEEKRDKSKTEVKDKTELVNQYKKFAAAISSRLGTLKSLRDEIAKADQAGQYAVAYWLLECGDYRGALKRSPKLIKPDELQQKLVSALDALATAEWRLAADERAVTRCRDALTTAKARLDDHVANADKNLRAELEQMRPSAPATGGGIDHA